MKTEKAFLDALNGQKPDRIPFWLMRQAGRYLPEYRELRAKKKGFLEAVMDPIAACEITMQPLRRFGMDAAIIFSDILVVPQALGQKVEFVEGEGPKLEPLRIAADVTRLGFREFESKLSPLYEALGRVKTELSSKGFNSTALIGFAGAPWTLAAYMIEGGGSRDFITAKVWAYQNPEAFSSLLGLLSESIAACLIHQVKAGAEAVQIFDSWSGVLDPQAFAAWVIAPTREIVRSVRASYPNIPIIGFPRGAGQHYLAYARETGITAVSLDTQVPQKWAAQVLQPLMPVQGNLDPAYLLAGGDPLALAAEKIIGDLSHGPFVFNLGHGVHKDTPPGHVEKLAGILRGH